MYRLPSKHAAVALVALLISSLMVGIEPALAHGGHAHADDGLDLTVLYQVAGTAMVMGIGWMVATRVYRWRDARREDRDA